MMKKKQVYVYKAFERFWHWMQALLIFFLAFTGFEIHGSYTFFGFKDAVKYHNIAAYMLIILIVFAIFWHFSTGEWRQYIPSFKSIAAQDRKSTRLNSSHVKISYAVFCLKKKN